MPKGRTRTLVDGILGQHLALPVAAHLARTQLVPDPLGVYDAEHLNAMIELVARALAKVAPLYVMDAGSGEPRELSAAELEGSSILRGATLLVLRDGRTLSSVTVKRAELRQAIAILKTVGLEGLALPRKADAAPVPAPRERGAELLSRMGEIEGLLKPPLAPMHVERVNRLMVTLAREAPSGEVSNLAMRLMSAVQEALGSKELPASVRVELSRLRAAIEDSEEA